MQCMYVFTFSGTTYNATTPWVAKKTTVSWAAKKKMVGRHRDRSGGEEEDDGSGGAGIGRWKTPCLVAMKTAVGW